jgi:CPA2 family monovalent cation:H+ antiporter-2
MHHLSPLIIDLGLILGAGAVMTLIFKKLKQPVILGYLLAGILVGPNFSLFPTITDQKDIEVLGEIGVIFLLFSLGLEFSFKKLIKVGAAASVTAIIKVLFMLLLGYLAGVLLGWSSMDSIFLGGILAISSTTIIIRAFEEMGVKGQKFANLVFGILVVEDIVAVVLLVLLSTLGVTRHFAGQEMLISIAKLIFYLVLWFVAGIFFLPSLLKMVKKYLNDETLLVTSLALCMLMVYLATRAGFSPALGAFIIGSILAETTQAERIEHLVKSVKDLFGAVFFVSVGMLIDPQMLLNYAGPVLLISFITIAGKLISTTIGSIIAGQGLKTSVQAGMSLSPIGEFSFIIAALGVTLNVTSHFLYPIAVAVSAVTAFATPFLIRSADPFYRWTDRALPPNIKAAIIRYSSGSQNIQVATDWQKLLRAKFYNIILHSTIIISIIVLSSTYLIDAMNEKLNWKGWANQLAAIITLIMLLPFLWALAIKKVYTDETFRVWSEKRYRGSVILLQIFRILLAIFFIGFFLDRFVSQQLAYMMVIVLVVVLFFFSKRIQSFYFRLEDRFLANLNDREREQVLSTEPDLAPWDAHMANFEIKSESSIAGQSLLSLGWREQFGINVAIIERGEHRITVPGREEVIFPYDNLSVIGTDEQIEKFNQYLDVVNTSTHITKTKTQVTLERITISQDSPFLNMSIRNSGIREKTHGLVVGVEHNNIRILNPESDYVFKQDDVVWIVGNRLRILAVQKTDQRIELKLDQKAV